MASVKVTKEELMEAAQKAVTISRITKILSEIIDLVLEKNEDYGDAWQRYGVFTPLIRINDKILRVAKLSDGSDAIIAEESIEDTLKDIIGYALLALVWKKYNRGANTWTETIASTFGIDPEMLK